MSEVLWGGTLFLLIAMSTLLFMRQWRWWPLAGLALWLPTVLPMGNNLCNVIPLWGWLVLIFLPLALYGLYRGANVNTIVGNLLTALRQHPLLALPGLAVCAVCFCASLGPEVRGDSIIYHITAAQLFAFHNRMVEIPTSILTYIPQAQQLLYACCLSADSETLARLMHWFAGILLGVGTYETARHVLNLSRGLSIAAASLFLLFPIWTYLASSTYVDLPTGLWILGALYVILLRPPGSGSADWKALALAAILAGAAIGTKYTAGVIGYAPLLCVLAVQQWMRVRNRQDTWKSSACKIVFFAAIGMVVFSPWLIRNTIWTGNPVCPTLMGLLGPADIPPSTLAWGDIQPGPKFVGNVTSVAMLYPAMFWAFGDFGNYLPQLALILGLLCFALRLPKRCPDPVVLILIFLVVSYVVGIPSGAIRRDARYIMGHVALCSLLIVYWYRLIIVANPDKERMLQRLGAGCIALMTVASAHTSYKMFQDLNEEFFPPMSQTGRENYRASRLNDYRANMALVVPEDGGVLGASYPAKAAYILVGQPIAPQYFMPQPGGVSPQDFPKLRAAGITYILGHVPEQTAPELHHVMECDNLPLYSLPE